LVRHWGLGHHRWSSHLPPLKKIFFFWLPEREYEPKPWGHVTLSCCHCCHGDGEPNKAWLGEHKWSSGLPGHHLPCPCCPKPPWPPHWRWSYPCPCTLSLASSGTESLSDGGCWTEAAGLCSGPECTCAHTGAVPLLHGTVTAVTTAAHPCCPCRCCLHGHGCCAVPWESFLSGWLGGAYSPR
jgi:hypothetical protein